jgi:hypothetical protein
VVSGEVLAVIHARYNPPAGFAPKQMKKVDPYRIWAVRALRNIMYLSTKAKILS